jgi:hypothetical protein
VTAIRKSLGKRLQTQKLGRTVTNEVFPLYLISTLLLLHLSTYMNLKEAAKWKTLKSLCERDIF